MYSVEEIKMLNEKYEQGKIKLQKELKELEAGIKNVNNSIDLEEVSEMSYEEIKAFTSVISYLCSDGMREQLKKIKDDTKVRENPKILEVHYFPIISKIEFLSAEEKKILDNDLRKNRCLPICYFSHYVNSSDFYSDNLIEALVSYKLIEPTYVFVSDENNEEEDVIDYKTFNKFKKYWEKESNNEETTQEEDEECQYGYIEINFEDYSYEINSYDEFTKNLERIEYKISAIPDLTLEKL